MAGPRVPLPHFSPSEALILEAMYEEPPHSNFSAHRNSR